MIALLKRADKLNQRLGVRQGPFPLGFVSDWGDKLVEWSNDVQYFEDILDEWDGVERDSEGRDLSPLASLKRELAQLRKQMKQAERMADTVADKIRRSHWSD